MGAIMGKIGFTAGAFDMFHIGHLNLIKNAKKNCDHLIVGVNSDELIQQYKNKTTIIPFEERAAIVKSIKYVDEVLKIDSLDKEIIWSENNYDYLFIGSDWKGNDRWNKTEEIMANYGVEVIYLPYTQSTSSTILRQKLLKY